MEIPFDASLENDDVTGEFLQEREALHSGGFRSPEFSQIIKELAEHQAAQTSQQQPDVPPQQEEPQEGRGFFGDVAKGMTETPWQILGGAADAVNGVISLIDAGYDWVSEHWDALHDFHEEHPDLWKLPTTDKADTVTGGVVRGVSQFLTGFIPALRGVKMLGWGSKLGNSLLAGAAADALVFDPLDKRLSNLIQEVPALENPVTEFLAADPEDGQAEGRFKNALEGLALGGLSEGLVTAFKAYRGLKNVPAIDDAKPSVTETIEADVALNPEALIDAPVPKIKPVFKVNPKLSDGLMERIRAGQAGELGELADLTDFNIDHIKTSEDVHQVFEAVSDVYKDGVKQAMDGHWKKPQSIAVENAKLFGVKPNELEKLSKSVQNLDEKFLAAKSLTTYTATQMDQVTKAILDGDNSDQMLVKWKHLADVHVAFQLQVKGIQTNIARGLAVMRQDVGTTKISKEGIDVLSKNAGSMEAVREQFKRFNLLDSKLEADTNKFLRDTVGATTSDAVYFYWINSILSGPQTLAVNCMSNAISMTMDVVESTTAATFNKFRPGGGEVGYMEALSRLVGIWGGMWDNFKITRKVLDELNAAEGMSAKVDVIKNNQQEFGRVYRAFATDSPILDPMSKFEHGYKPVSSEAFGLTGTAGSIANFTGAVLGLPGRTLMTTDEVFKNVAFRSELYAQLTRDAQQRGIKGFKNIREHIEKWMENPPKEFVDTALEKARYLTFQTPLGEGGQSLQRFIGSNTTLKFIVPFIRTPTNIIKYIGHRTPGINLLSETYRADIAAGGARAELARAKVAMGTAMYGSALMLAANGLITGGADKENKDKNALINRQSYSLKIGDEWVSFSRMDPFGAFFGLTADLVELAPRLSDGDYEEVANAAIISLSRNVVSKTYLKGIMDLTNALQDPKRYGAQWFRNFFSGFVPNFMAQANRLMFDEQMKEIDSLRDAMYRRIPGFSEDVMPRRNAITGEPMVYGKGYAGGLLPLYRAKETDDPVLQELFRLDVNVTDLPRIIKGIELSPKQYDDYQILATQNVRDRSRRNLHEKLLAFINSDRYQKLTDSSPEFPGSKAKAIRKIINSYRHTASKKMLMQDPELLEKVKELQLQKRQQLTP